VIRTLLAFDFAATCAFIANRFVRNTSTYHDTSICYLIRQGNAL